MGGAERHPLAHQPLGDVGGQGESLRGHLGHAVQMEDGGVHHAGHGGQQQVQLVDLVEDRLLVLLQIPGVGQRQTLEGGHEPRQIADEAASLATGELGDVGVLLLRHDRRAGGERVVQGDVGELPGVPDDDLLAEPGEVDADLGTDEGELGHHVTGGGAVDGIGHRAAESQLTGNLDGVESE